MTQSRETTEANLDKACARLSDALERIVDGLDSYPSNGPDQVEDAEEINALRERIAVLEDEVEALRAAGRSAADGIGETIAALEEARR